MWIKNTDERYINTDSVILLTVAKRRDNDYRIIALGSDGNKYTVFPGIDTEKAANAILRQIFKAIEENEKVVDIWDCYRYAY